MALDIRRLAAIGYADGFTRWRYVSPDGFGAIFHTPGYFNGAAHMLRAGDEIIVQGATAIWRDFVWSNDGSGVFIGVNPLVVDPGGPEKHRLGEILVRWDGSVWEYRQAGGTIAGADAVIMHDDHFAQALTTALAAPGTGSGKRIGWAPALPSEVITFGKYFWCCVFSPEHVKQACNVLPLCAKYTALYTTTTPGKLDDDPTGSTLVRGVAIWQANGGSTGPVGASINYPQV